MFASSTNYLTVVSELLVVFLESVTIHVYGTVHVYDIIHVYGTVQVYGIIQVYGTVHVYGTIHVYSTIHVKRWERSKNFTMQSRE